MYAKLAVLLAVFAGGCGTPPHAVVTDVQAYLAQMKQWSPQEAESARAIARILSTQFVDEAEVRHQIADDRPRVQAHLDRARAYQPRVPQVAEIHRAYVRAWERLLDGYDAIEKGFDTHEYANLARGREALFAWRRGIRSVADRLRALMEEYDLEPGVTTRRDNGPRPRPT